MSHFKYYKCYFIKKCYDEFSDDPTKHIGYSIERSLTMSSYINRVFAPELDRDHRFKRCIAAVIRR